MHGVDGSLSPDHNEDSTIERRTREREKMKDE
jgi:hypothetical protein